MGFGCESDDPPNTKLFFMLKKKDFITANDSWESLNIKHALFFLSLTND